MQKSKINFKAKNNENTVEMSRFSSCQRINCKYVGTTSGRPIFEGTSKNSNGITLVALIVTILFSYDEMIKFSNSKGFLLATI